MVSDRYLFLPSLALPWALSLLPWRRVAVALLVALAGLFAVLTVRYEALFGDERTFFAAMEIAAAMCIYTNEQIVLFTLDDAPEAEDLPAERERHEPVGARES